MVWLKFKLQVAHHFHIIFLHMILIITSIIINIIVTHKEKIHLHYMHEITKRSGFRCL